MGQHHWAQEIRTTLVDGGGLEVVLSRSSVSASGATVDLPSAASFPVHVAPSSSARSYHNQIR